MSDVVKIIFDGDLTPLQQKQAVAKGELNAFVTESEAEIKGISSAGEAIGVSVQKGAQSFSQYYRPVINDLSRDIKALGVGFEKTLGVEGSKAARVGLDDLAISLKKLNNNGYEAAASSGVLNTELGSISKQIKAYQLELAEAAQANIFFAESQKVAAASGSGGKLSDLGARPLQGYGGLFRASGLTNAGVNEVEANAALSLLGKLSGGDAEKATAALQAVAVATKGVEEAQQLLSAARLKTAAATLAEEAAAKGVVLAESANVVTDGQLIAADNTLLAASEAVTVAKVEETAATETLTAANGELAVAATAAAAAEGVTLAALLPLVAAGVAVIAVVEVITGSLAQSGRERLQNEIAISTEYGKQQKALFDMKQASIDFANSRANTAKDDEFTRNLAKTNPILLETQRNSALENVEVIRNRQRNERIFADPTTQQKALDATEIQRAENQVRELDKALLKARDDKEKFFADASDPTKDDQRRQKASADAAQGFRDDVQAAKGNVAELKKILSEASLDSSLLGHDRSSLLSSLKNQIDTNIKEAQAQVEKLTKGYKEEFGKLFEGANSENPFAKQAIESAKALEVLDEKLKGVGPELRKQAEDLQAAANAQQKYTLQINSAFQSIDLRAQADRFRNPTQKELQGRLDSQISEFNRTSNSTNPDVFYNFQQEQARITNSSRDILRDTLDKKLDVAAGAQTEAQKAIADKAVTSFASGLNPDDLTTSERGRIAKAFEDSAVRNEKRQEEALEIQKELLATMKSIDKRGVALSGVAGEGGKTALDITLKDDTSDKKATAATATPDDVAKTYTIDFFAGSNK